ncbi:MAG: PKD domain-containing protein, partial [Thermoplasmata archaeon]
DLADATNSGQLFSQGGITTTAEVADPGSDDLFFTWEWGDGTSTEHTYYNDGLGPDTYPSPDVNPMAVVDLATHKYPSSGNYTVILTVRDEDGGISTVSMVVAV